MRHLHLIIGLLTVSAFIGTGVYLHFQMPAMLERDATLRFTHRANHVYLLLAGLLNVVAATHRDVHPRRWRRIMALIGAGLLLAAPLVLFAAFLMEAHSTSEFRPVTAVGVMIAFVGTMMYLFRWQRRSAPSSCS